jgi:BirA family transcriptional regulator, biotin operon repressor / biotin---[acetyl-CoA-carboxylase] ligase
MTLLSNRAKVGTTFVTSDKLDPDGIQRDLPTRFVGRHVVFFAATDSTNSRAKELAHGDAPDGTLVIADSQTSGRGRLNRQWLAAPGTSLLLSLILRPPLAPAQAARITMVCALAMADSIETVAGLPVRVKWPNDLLINGRKAGGILTELGLQDHRLGFAVVGIGLNVNVDFDAPTVLHASDEAPDTSRVSVSSLAVTATSLSRELGHDVSRLQLLRRFLINVETRYEALQRGHTPVREWSRRLETLGHLVTVTDAAAAITGWAEDVDADGALLLRRPDGQLVVIRAGDVTLRPPAASI